MHAPPDTTAAVDPSRCPLCGQPNACAAQARRATGLDQPPCWCMTATFSPEVLRRVPAAARNAACICPACCAGAEPVQR